MYFLLISEVMDEEVSLNPELNTEKNAKPIHEPIAEVAVDEDQEGSNEENQASEVNIDALVKEEPSDTFEEYEDAFCESQISKDTIALNDSEAVTRNIVKDEPGEFFEGDEFETDTLSDNQLPEDPFPETSSSEYMLEQIKSEPSEDLEEEKPLSKRQIAAKVRKMKEELRKIKRRGKKYNKCPDKGCNESFAFKSLLDKHYLNVHKKKYPCGFCDMRYVNLGGVKEHREKKHPEKKPPYYCKVCDRKFKCMNARLRHEKDCKGKIKPKPSAAAVPTYSRPSGPVKRHPCSICKERFVSIKDLLGHFRMDHQSQNEIPLRKA